MGRDRDRGGRQKTRVHVTPTDEGVQIHLVGDRAREFDTQLVEDCANALFRCADANGCLEGGFTLTKDCATTLVGHDMQSDCMASGFGLVEVEARRQ